MVQIVDGEVIHGDSNMNAMGGTEQMAYKLVEHIGKENLSGFQIVLSRIEHELLDDKIRIFWAHDLPGDPSSEFLKNPNERNKFHKLVFVSNWQMQNYINYYDLKWSECIVLQNAINPIETHKKPTHTINITYFSTPHRGLDLLVPVFEKIAEKHDNAYLNIYSSFDLYGWGERDKQHKQTLDMIEAHPRMKNLGSVDNNQIREMLKEQHILAYPCIWQETSCLVLMEAMSAGLVCIHPNYGALYETAANWTMMYQQQEQNNIHMSYLYSAINMAIDSMNKPHFKDHLRSMKSYSDVFYSWKRRAEEWQTLLSVLKHSIKDTKIPEEVFSYSSRV